MKSWERLAGLSAVILFRAIPSGAPLLTHLATKVDRREVSVGEAVRVEISVPIEPGEAAPQVEFPKLQRGVAYTLVSQGPLPDDSSPTSHYAYTYLFSFAKPGPAQAVRLVVGFKGASGLSLPAELSLGELAAGKSLVKEIPLVASESLTVGKARAGLEVKEANGFDAPPIVLEFETRALKPPKLALAGVSIGGLGVVKAGEIAEISVIVRNMGVGAAKDATASLAVGSQDIFVSGESLVSLGTLEPGQTKTVEFQFVVNNRFKGKSLPLSALLTESRGKYGAEASLGLALGESAPETKLVSVQGKAESEAPRAAPEVENVDVPPASKIAEDPEAFAVVIGIEKYRQEGIPAVDFAARDAKTMQAYLTKAMGFPEENVILLQNEKAAKTDLDKYLGKWLKNQVSEKSRVFIYYAGHGAPNPATGEGFLIPYDGDPNYTEETAYPIKKLYEALARLPARGITVALDACFSGQGERSLLAKGARPLVNVASEPDVAGENTVIIAAAQGNQISTSFPDGRHGLLTYYLLKGLLGGADGDQDGQVTTAELFSYIKPAVSRQARRQNVEQVPSFHPASERLGARGGEAWTRVC